jgi:hypothetical protein
MPLRIADRVAQDSGMSPLETYRRLQRRWLRLRADAQAPEAELDAHLDALDAAWYALDAQEQRAFDDEAARWAQRLRASLPAMVDTTGDGGSVFPRRRADEAA